MGMVANPSSVAGGLLAAYRDLVPAEATLGELLARDGARVGVSVVDRWPTLREYVQLYATGLAPAGALVLAGAPDAGSRATGVPFTGARFARETLGLAAAGDAASPLEGAFWGAVRDASAANSDAPVESLFGTAHLAHAVPFDVPQLTRPVLDASAAHVLRLLRETRPQIVLALGADALGVLARATGDARVRDVAELPERAWSARWSASVRLHECPFVDVPATLPFRARLLPVASLDGEDARTARGVLAGALARVWAG